MCGSGWCVSTSCPLRIPLALLMLRFMRKVNPFFRCWKCKVSVFFPSYFHIPPHLVCVIFIYLMRSCYAALWNTWFWLLNGSILLTCVFCNGCLNQGCAKFIIKELAPFLFMSLNLNSHSPQEVGIGIWIGMTERGFHWIVIQLN